jgi:hypothetical protein
MHAISYGNFGVEVQHLIPKPPGPVIQKGCGQCRYGGQLQIHYISSYGQPIKDEVLDVGLTPSQRESMLQNIIKPQWKRALGRPRHTWENNIKMDLRMLRCRLGSTV